MIDTDRYEGHTKGDNEVGWRINNNFVSNGKCPNDRYIAYVQDGKVMEFSEADANLIADAPLLLEELKRLHKERDKMRELLLRGVKLMNNASKTTDEGNDYFAESFEDAVMEVIE